MTDGEDNLKEFWDGFWKVIQKILIIIEGFPPRLKFLGILAVCVILIVVPSILFIGDSNIVLLGLAIILIIIVISVFFVTYMTDKKRIELVEKKVEEKFDQLPKEKMLVEFLKGAASNVSKTLGIPTGKLRSNIFMPDPDEGSYLKIPKGLHYNMENPDELTVKIPPGYGCTGNAFSNKEPTIAILKEDWGKYILDDVEMEKVDKNLVWIVSMPIPLFGTPGKIIGVLNVDCLNMKKEKEELEKITGDMLYWANLISQLIKRKEKP